MSSPGQLGRWLPVVAWAAVIWTLSSGWFTGELTGSFLLPILAALFPHATPGQLRAMHQGIRKLALFIEYLVLSLLLYRALRGEGRWNLRSALLAIALAGLYALTDEAHQRFVPGRVAALTDCLIDVSGAAVGQALVVVRERVLRLRPEPV